MFEIRRLPNKTPAVAALEDGEMPLKEYVKLNKSAFGLPDDEEDVDEFRMLFWRMGISAFEKLFKAIDRMKPKSLSLTRKVLTRREELETYIENVQPMIRNGYDNSFVSKSDAQH